MRRSILSCDNLGDCIAQISIANGGSLNAALKVKVKNPLVTTPEQFHGWVGKVAYRLDELIRANLWALIQAAN